MLLFEDFKNDLKAQQSDTQHTWTDLRDAIQMKRPFVIIVFRTKSSYLEAIQTELSQYDYIKQIAIKQINNKQVKYPSVFFVIDKDVDFRPKIKELYEEFDIKEIIFGEPNQEFADSYAQDGTSSPTGNELVSGLSASEFESEDHFKVGSMFYRFIEFNG